MKLHVIALLMLSVISMFSCNKGSSDHQANTVTQDIMMESSTDVADKIKSRELSDTTSIQPPTPNVLQGGNPAVDWDKKIIKTANVTLELENFKAYNSSLHNNLKKYGAYIAGEEQVQSDDRIENVVTIKVPVLQFEPLMNSFNGEGIKVINRRISTEDVTGEVVDTKARVAAKKQVRDRFLDLLKQAKNMKEILEVQKEINSIQEDLETADGRVNYMVNQSAYSTIHLVYYQYTNGASNSNGFISKLKEAFSDGGRIISGSVLVLVTIWPLIFAGFIIWFLIKRWKTFSPTVKKI